jgi:hypothetical protein
MTHIFRRLVNRYVLFALVVMVVAAAALVLTIGSTTFAGSPAAPLDAFTCTATGVAAFDNRVHVRCNPAAPGGIAYFAVCTAPDAAKAARYLSVFTTAKATGKNLVVYYNASDTSGTACGCSSGDCRLVVGAEVQQ